MKTTQEMNDRIKEFIDSIADKQTERLLEDGELDLVVGGLANTSCAENGTCENRTSCGKTVNQICSNADGQCVNADNPGRCTVLEIKLPPGTTNTSGSCLISNQVESSCKKN